MDGIQEFNEQTQRAKVGAGFKGGPYFKSPITHPKMTFVDGVPSEVTQKMTYAGAGSSGKMGPTYSERKMK